MQALDQVQTWPAEAAAVLVIDADGQVKGEYGPQNRQFAIASVTKLLSAYAVLIAVEEGAIALDDPAGPPGATIRHLLAHASGMAPDTRDVMARPGTRRIYSHEGFVVLAEAVEAASRMSFPQYLSAAVLSPLRLSDSSLVGSPASGARSTVADLGLFVTELQNPRLLPTETVRAATSVAFPGLDGVLPGYGRQQPNDWGLGFEIRDGKVPHWTGSLSTPSTFGHFGRTGTFVWVDPGAGYACVCLTNRDFGAWAIDAWPALTDAILTELHPG